MWLDGLVQYPALLHSSACEEKHFPVTYNVFEEEAVCLKFAGITGHVQQIFKISGEKLLLNSMKRPAEKFQLSSEAKKDFAYTAKKVTRH